MSHTLRAKFLATTPTTHLINSTINLTSSFDGGGDIYQRGPSLGDYPIMKLSGTHNTLRNVLFDDSNLGGQNGTVAVTGTDNSILDCALRNCQRYGFIVSAATRARLTGLTITKGQHCISGSSGYTGDWRSPSYDTIIENNNISGMIIDGIKLKQMVRTIVRNNTIDVFPNHPGYDGGTTTYSKSGVYFAATDTANKDCLIENNNIFQSKPTPSGLPSNRAVLANADQTAYPDVISTGNRIQNNTFTDVYTGVWLRGSNYFCSSNKMVNVRVPYDNDGSNNTIIP